MDTVLNLGLNDISVQGLAKLTGNEKIRIRLIQKIIQMFSDVVVGLSKPEFEKVIDQMKEEKA